MRNLEHVPAPDATPSDNQPDVEGDVPETEHIDPADFEERLEEEPEEATNRRDVPPTPENSRAARTED